jgi:hypothetical protein
MIKDFLSGLFKTLFLMGLVLWICFTYPDQILAFFEFIDRMLPIFLFAAASLGMLISLLASLFASPPPPAPGHSTPIANLQSPNSARPQPASATPFLLGLTLGWWLGHNPGNDSHSR